MVDSTTEYYYEFTSPALGDVLVTIDRDKIVLAGSMPTAPSNPVELTPSDPALVDQLGEGANNVVYQPLNRRSMKLRIVKPPPIMRERIFAADDDYFAVHVWRKDTNGDYTELYWAGYTVTDLWKDAPDLEASAVEITAQDSLSLIEHVSLSDLFNENTEYKHSQILGTVLTDMQTSRQSKNPVVSQRVYDSESPNDDSPIVTRFYSLLYENNEESPYDASTSARNLLEDVLNRHNLELYQALGRWVARGIDVVDPNTGNWRGATMSLPSEITIDPSSIDLDGPLLETPDQSYNGVQDISREGIEPISSVAAELEFGSSNLILNGDFEETKDFDIAGKPSISYFWEFGNQYISESILEENLYHTWREYGPDTDLSGFDHYLEVEKEQEDQGTLFCSGLPNDGNYYPANQNEMPYVEQKGYHRIPDVSEDAIFNFKFSVGGNGASTSDGNTYDNDYTNLAFDQYEWSFHGPYDVSVTYNDGNTTYTLAQAWDTQFGTDADGNPLDGNPIVARATKFKGDDVEVPIEKLMVPGAQEGIVAIAEGTELLGRQSLYNDELVRFTVSRDIKYGDTKMYVDLESRIYKGARIGWYYWTKGPAVGIDAQTYPEPVFVGQQELTDIEIKAPLHTESGENVRGESKIRFTRHYLPETAARGFDGEVALSNVSVELEKDGSDIDAETVGLQTKQNGVEDTYKAPMSIGPIGTYNIYNETSGDTILDFEDLPYGALKVGNKWPVSLKGGFYSGAKSKDVNDILIEQRIQRQSVPIDRLRYVSPVYKDVIIPGQVYTRDDKVYTVGYYRASHGSSTSNVELELNEYNVYEIPQSNAFGYLSPSTEDDSFLSLSSINISNNPIEGVSDWGSLQNRPTQLYAAVDHPDAIVLDGSRVNNILGYVPFDESGGEISGNVGIGTPAESGAMLTVKENSDFFRLRDSDNAIRGAWSRDSFDLKEPDEFAWFDFEYKPSKQSSGFIDGDVGIRVPARNESVDVIDYSNEADGSIQSIRTVNSRNEVLIGFTSVNGGIYVADANTLEIKRELVSNQEPLYSGGFLNVKTDGIKQGLSVSGGGFLGLKSSNIEQSGAFDPNADPLVEWVDFVLSDSEKYMAAINRRGPGSYAIYVFDVEDNYAIVYADNNVPYKPIIRPSSIYPDRFYEGSSAMARNVSVKNAQDWSSVKSYGSSSRLVSDLVDSDDEVYAIDKSGEIAVFDNTNDSLVKTIAIPDYSTTFNPSAVVNDGRIILSQSNNKGVLVSVDLNDETTTTSEVSRAGHLGYVYNRKNSFIAADATDTGNIFVFDSQNLSLRQEIDMVENAGVFDMYNDNIISSGGIGYPSSKIEVRSLFGYALRTTTSQINKLAVSSDISPTSNYSFRSDRINVTDFVSITDGSTEIPPENKHIVKSSEYGITSQIINEGGNRDIVEALRLGSISYEGTERLWSLTSNSFNENGADTDTQMSLRAVAQNKGEVDDIYGFQIEVRNRGALTTENPFTEPISANKMVGLSFGDFVGATNNAPAPSTFRGIEFDKNNFYNTGNDAWAIWDDTALGWKTNGVVETSGDINHPEWNPGLNYWGITEHGYADFRELTVDELIADVFTANVWQSLSGNDILTKSAADLSEAYDRAYNPQTLRIEVPQGANPNLQVFSDDDVIRLRSVSRSNGGLQFTDAWLKIDLMVGASTQEEQIYSVSVLDAPYNFKARKGSRALDYGRPGDTIIERSVTDVGAPYDRILRWQDDNGDEIPTTFSVVSQLGNISTVASIPESDLQGIYTDSARFEGDLVIGSLDKTGDYLEYDGTDLTVTGGIIADNGDIGGWTIENNRLESGSTATGLVEINSDDDLISTVLNDPSTDGIAAYMGNLANSLISSTSYGFGIHLDGEDVFFVDESELFLNQFTFEEVAVQNRLWFLNSSGESIGSLYPLTDSSNEDVLRLSGQGGAFRNSQFANAHVSITPGVGREVRIGGPTRLLSNTVEVGGNGETLLNDGDVTLTDGNVKIENGQLLVKELASHPPVPPVGYVSVYAYDPGATQPVLYIKTETGQTFNLTNT